jgi:hypothetical protein
MERQSLRASLEDAASEVGEVVGSRRGRFDTGHAFGYGEFMRI